MQVPKSINKDDVIRLVRRQLGRTEVNDHDRLMEDLAAESADIVNLVAAMEDEFGLHVPEAEIASIRTVGDLHALLDRYA